MEPIASVMPRPAPLPQTPDPLSADDGGDPRVAPATEPPPEGAAIGLIRRWIELSELERRVFIALARELTVSSELIEVSANGLSERFQALAAIAQAQMGRVDQIIAVASSVDVDGETVTLDSALESVQGAVGKAIDTILFVSKHARRMVQSLEDVARDVKGMEACTAKIEAVNQQARYLALNAAIEANRSGAAGDAFGVIANEMKQLSMTTDSTAMEVRAQIAAAALGVRSGLDVLQEIADLDLAENVTTKQRIDSLIAGLVAQHTAFHDVLTETAESSAEIGATIGRLVHGMQFQDRTKQHLAQVIDTLAVLRDGTVEAQQATADAYPGMFQPGQLDAGLLAHVVEKQRLGDMKARMLARLLGDAESQADDPVQEPDNDIELF